MTGQRSVPQRGVPLHPAGHGRELDPGEPAHVHGVSQLRGGQVLQVARHRGLWQRCQGHRHTSRRLEVSKYLQNEDLLLNFHAVGTGAMKK